MLMLISWLTARNKNGKPSFEGSTNELQRSASQSDYVEEMPMEKEQMFQMPMEQEQMFQTFDDNCSNMYNCGPHHHPGESSGVISVVSWPDVEINMQDELVAVVVTVVEGSSYDSLFRTVPQLAGEGERVAVYQAPPATLPLINKVLDGEAADSTGGEALAQLAKDVSAVNPDAVVFNWECCSGCDDGGFSAACKTATLECMEKVISRGSMVMASDFSLKALIADWAPDLLGPNPFVKIGEFDSNFRLEFDPETLKECPSSQLVKVGELCSEGHAESHALGGTIAYTVDGTKCQTQAYTLEVLTVVSRMSGFNMDKLESGQRCTIGEGKTGAAGHVLLTYPTGGKLLTSAGHWIELSKLDVSLEDLFKVAEANYGGEYVAKMRSNMNEMQEAGASNAMLNEWVSEQSCKMVQQSAPCKYSKGGY